MRPRGGFLRSLIVFIFLFIAMWMMASSLLSRARKNVSLSMKTGEILFFASLRRLRVSCLSMVENLTRATMGLSMS